MRVPTALDDQVCMYMDLLSHLLCMSYPALLAMCDVSLVIGVVSFLSRGHISGAVSTLFMHCVPWQA